MKKLFYFKKNGFIEFGIRKIMGFEIKTYPNQLIILFIIINFVLPRVGTIFHCTYYFNVEYILNCS